jgi:hypothetical protein
MLAAVFFPGDRLFTKSAAGSVGAFEIFLGWQCSDTNRGQYWWMNRRCMGLSGGAKLFFIRLLRRPPDYKKN